MGKVLVQKYGGSSVATTSHIKLIAKRIKESRKNCSQIVVVLSAMQHMTDNLIALAKQISPSPDNREMDMLMTAGERISMSLLGIALNDIQVPAISLTGSQVGILTDEVHTNAKIKEIKAFRLEDELKKGKVGIVAGFQGVSSFKEVTTLGRGGSDTTAVALAVALRANKCEIYTDVEGVYSADPNFVPAAIKLDKIGYDEMLEMAYFGAKVMHPRAIALAERHHLPIIVRSSFNNNPGTEISEEGSMEQIAVRGITKKDNISIIKISGLKNPNSIKTLFLLLNEERYFPIITVQEREEMGKIALHLVMSNEEIFPAYYHIRDKQNEVGFAEIQVIEKLALINVVGQGISTSLQLSAILYDVLDEIGITCVLSSNSNISYAFAVQDNQVGKVTAAFHERLLKEGLLTTTIKDS